MFNRQFCGAIVWSCAATTCVSANAISDWNEKTVDRNLARALAGVATQLSKIGDHIVDLELKFAQLQTINGNLHEQRARGSSAPLDLPPLPRNLNWNYAIGGD